MPFSIGYPASGTIAPASWTTKVVETTHSDVGINAYIFTPNIRTITYGYLPVTRLRRTLQTTLAGGGGSARPATGLLFPRGIPTRSNN